MYAEAMESWIFSFFLSLSTASLTSTSVYVFQFSTTDFDELKSCNKTFNDIGNEI